MSDHLYSAMVVFAAIGFVVTAAAITVLIWFVAIVALERCSVFKAHRTNREADLMLASIVGEGQRKNWAPRNRPGALGAMDEPDEIERGR
jgi:hypothetical protein